MATTDSIKGTGRIAEVIDIVAHARTPLSSRQIINKLEAPRSSGYDLLGGLVERGYLHKRAVGQWILGDEIHTLAMSRFGLGSIATHIVTVLYDLQEKTQEVAQLVVLHELNVLVTHAYSSLRSMQLAIDAGTESTLDCIAAGRLLVSDLDDRSLQRLLAASTRPSPTGAAAINAGDFVDEVRESRRRGYALAIERVLGGSGSIAAPVIGKRNTCVAAVNLLLPVVRMQNNQDTLVSLVCSAAGKLTHALVNSA